MRKWTSLVRLSCSACGQQMDDIALEKETCQLCGKKQISSTIPMKIMKILLWEYYNAQNPNVEPVGPRTRELCIE